MGFMNFLKKKESPELSFKPPVEVSSPDTHMEIPPPNTPVKIPSPQDVPVETISEPAEPVPDPFADMNHEDFMPPSKESTEQIPLTEEPEHTIPEPEHPSPELENAISEPPIPESTESLTLPDLPELPQEESTDTATPEEDLTAPEKPIEEPTVFEAEPQTTEETVAEPSEEALDSFPEDTSAEYLSEEPEDTPVQEHYIEAHVFYKSLLEIKSMKRNLRDQETDMRAWEETDDKLEKKTAGVFKNIDNIQEDLIKIDTVLFEG